MSIIDARLERSPAIATSARIGYAGRGVLYVVVAFIAAQLAFGTRAETPNEHGALRLIAEQPLGKVLLGVVAFCLGAYALWRFAQALINPERALKPLARVGAACAGVSYALLSVAAVKILDTGDAHDEKHQWTARLLSMEAGKYILGAVGLILIGVGLFQFFKAFTDKWREELGDGPRSHAGWRAVTWITRVGLSARGVVFIIFGGFLASAAVKVDPREARGLDGVLYEVLEQPFGPWLLLAVAIGLLAFGLHSFVLSRYHHGTRRALV
jgi:hypothetical protein